MKKKYGLMILTIITLLMVGCGKKLSEEDIIKEWDTNVSYFANLSTDLMVDDSLTDEDIFKRINNIKGEIKKSDKMLKKADGNREMISSLEEINEQIMLSMEHTDNTIRGNQSTPKQEESYFLVGQKNVIFSEKYNGGKLPDSLTVMTNTLEKIQNNEILAENTEESSTLESSSRDLLDSSEENVGSDITKISKSPTDEQKETLLILANQQFKQDFPYKGSKLHSILGVLQDWTQDGESWYYKSQATTVNTYGAKEDVNVEIFITPTSPDTGEVEIISY